MMVTAEISAKTIARIASIRDVLIRPSEPVLSKIPAMLDGIRYGCA